MLRKQVDSVVAARRGGICVFVRFEPRLLCLLKANEVCVYVHKGVTWHRVGVHDINQVRFNAPQHLIVLWSAGNTFLEMCLFFPSARVV